MDIDRKSGTNKWLDKEGTELKQIQQYNTFIDMVKGTKMPDDYT